MVKQRIIESSVFILPLTAIRLLLLPRLGFVPPARLFGLMFDLALPSAYFHYQHKSDRELYIKLLGIESKEEAERETREKRMRFVSQFWSNSQYWH